MSALANHRSNLPHFRSQLMKMKVDLEVGKRTNEELEMIDSNLQLVREAKTRLLSYLEFLKRIKKMMETEDNDFKERRVQELSREITNALGIIFPVENFSVSLDVDLKHQHQRADLILKHKNGTERIPDVSEGKMLQQLISYTSSLGLTRHLGKDKLWMDEAFSVAHKDNLTKLAELVKFALEADMQIFMIEQSEDGYKDLPRREFRIEKDELTEEVILKSVLDY